MAKKSVLAKSSKMDIAKRPKPKHNFGRNQTETVSVRPLVVPHLQPLDVALLADPLHVPPLAALLLHLRLPVALQVDLVVGGLRHFLALSQRAESPPESARAAAPGTLR